MSEDFIPSETVLERDAFIMSTARGVLTYLAEQAEPISVNKLLSDVAAQCNVSEDTVSVAISRVASKLDFTYPRGVLHFSLRA